MVTMNQMTVTDLYHAVVGGGATTATLVVAFPVAIAMLSLFLKGLGRLRMSQTVANLGIAVGLAAVAVEVLALVYATEQYGVDPLADVSIFVLLGPPYLAVAATLFEHIVHPGTQESVRQWLRRVMMVCIATGVCYFILARLGFHVLILTSLLNFILFVVAIIGVLYLVARRFI